MSIHLGQIKFKTLDCDPCRSGDFVYSADVKSTLCRVHFDSQKVALIICVYTCICLMTIQGLAIMGKNIDYT